MNTFSGFIWLFIYSWILIFVIHQVIGGLLALFFRGIEKKNQIAVTLKEKI